MSGDLLAIGVMAALAGASALRARATAAEVARDPQPGMRIGHLRVVDVSPGAVAWENASRTERGRCDRETWRKWVEEIDRDRRGSRAKCELCEFGHGLSRLPSHPQYPNPIRSPMVQSLVEIGKQHTDMRHKPPGR